MAGRRDKSGDKAGARRQRAERKGRIAEIAAEAMLRAKGYRIHARRWRGSGGEVDLIAEKRGVIVFVEVKARASHTAGIAAVQPAARRRIERAAGQYITGHIRKSGSPLLPPCRFDLVTVSGWTLHHHENAWRADD